MDPHRAHRISEALREELTAIIVYEMEDPRLTGVTVTEVIISPDLKRARVAVSAGKEALEALSHARNHLRRELAGRLRLFRVPELDFEAQAGEGPRSRVEELLDRVRKTQEKKSPRTPN